MCFVHLTAIHPRDGDGRVSDIVQMCHHAFKTLLDCKGLVADQNLLIHESRTFAEPGNFDAWFQSTHKFGLPRLCSYGPGYQRPQRQVNSLQLVEALVNCVQDNSTAVLEAS